MAHRVLVWLWWLLVFLVDTAQPQGAAENEIRIIAPDVVDEGQAIEVVCTATNRDQLPQYVHWLKNGTRILPNPGEGISISRHVPVSPATVVSILKIKKARLGDEGYYKCRTASDHITHFIKVKAKDKDQTANTTTSKSPTSSAMPQSSAAETRHSGIGAIFLTSVMMFFLRLK